MDISKKKVILGIDIGGSHISAALIDPKSQQIYSDTFIRVRINSHGDAKEILDGWLSAIIACAKTKNIALNQLSLAIAMPGPFDYQNGICLIKGLYKYEALYGQNIKTYLSEALEIDEPAIRFRNDAEAFLAGEINANNYPLQVKTLGITLGTGLGSALSQNGVTHDANFAIIPFRNTIAEEYLSTRWFVARFFELTNVTVKDVKDLLAQTQYIEQIEQLFSEFTEQLCSFLTTIYQEEQFGALVIGGNITKTADRFLDKLTAALRACNCRVPIHLANLGEASAIVGASLLFNQNQTLNA